MSMMMMENPRHESKQASQSIGREATSFRIKRLGARPMTFQGSELGMAMSYTPSIPYWYEVNLYRTVTDRFVLAIKLFHQSEDQQDIARAWVFDSLADALDAMEAYDAAQDIRVTMKATTHLSIAELAAASMELTAKAAAARSHYAGLIGEFFYDLEQVSG